MNTERIMLYDVVILEADLPGTLFVKGNRATVVEVYGDHEGYELEFIDKDGSTLGVETIEASAVDKGIVKVIWKNP